MSNSVLSSMEDALAAYKQGQMVIIVDDEDRVTHARGLVCLAMRGTMLDRLKVPMMVPQAQNRSGFGTGFTISVEAVNGVSTGISAEDRSHTIKTLIDPNTKPDDIAMPGHIFPLRARDGGVLERRGQTEASVDMSALAGLSPAGIICEVMRDDGTMMRLQELGDFGKQHNLHIISVEQIAEYRLKLGQGNMADAVDSAGGADVPQQPLVTEMGRSQLPTANGMFTVVVYKDTQGFEHSALIKGDIKQQAPVVRVHSECLTGDAFGSLRCDCGPQLHTAMQRIDENGSGIVVYLRQEGRGIGLGNKIRAYALQDEGRDTVDANHELGFPADARSYDVAAAILNDLNVDTVRLLSNNPAKRTALTELGINVTERLPLVIDAQAHNASYLNTKATRMGHNFQADEA